MESIEEKVMQRYYAGMVETLEKEREGIHVSHLKFPCIRRAYYDMTEPSHFDYESAMRILIGMQMHLVPCDQHNELEVEWNGIKGRVDEYNEEEKLIWDKKFTKNPPHANRKRPRKHDERQVLYYTVLLQKNNYPVEKGGVLYINIDNLKQLSFKEVEIPADLKEIEEEMLAKKTILEKALDAGEPPEKKSEGWICRYCQHFRKCYTKLKPTPKVVR